MAAPRWLDETESRAWRGLIRMSWLLEAALARDLAREAGLSHADYQVLVVLSERPGHRVRMSELASLLLWSRSRLSHQIGRMEARGLVRREGCAGDARGAFATLASDGLRAIREAAPGHVESIRTNLFDQLSREQVEVLAGLTETVVEHLSASCPAEVGAQACDTVAADGPACVGDELISEASGTGTR